MPNVSRRTQDFIGPMYPRGVRGPDYRTPPVSVLQAVESQYGEGYLEQMSRRFNEALAYDPRAQLSSWYRSAERQAELVRSGQTKAVASSHVAGAATDVVPTSAAKLAQLYKRFTSYG